MATEVVSVVDPNSGSGYDYTTLNAWEAGEQGDLTGVRDEISIAKCRCTGGTADTTATTIAGWTTSASQYIKIWTDTSESYRHAGKYATGNKYRMELTNTFGIKIQEEFVRVLGLQFGLTTTGTGQAHGILADGVAADGDIRFGYCLAEGLSLYGTGAAYGFYGYDADGIYKVYNCIAHNIISVDNASDTGFYGFRFNGTTSLLNCTSFGNYNGFGRTEGTVSLVNCISANNTDDYTGTLTITYSASDDAQSGTGNIDWANEATDWGNVFTDYANGDFSLKNYTQAEIKVIGVGVDDPGSGLYSDDIVGATRSSTWDIGAFEYVAGGSPAVIHQSMTMGMGQ